MDLGARLGGARKSIIDPRTVGASPVQNIGAYGIEIKDVFHSLTAIHLKTGAQKEFAREECCFAYRDSVFKHEGYGDWCITAVTFQLRKRYEAKTNYGDVAQELERQSLQATAKNISTVISQIRLQKLPNPAEIGNAGSFFQNPIVSQELVGELVEQYPALVKYKVSEETYKLAAAWLIEQSGWKGRALGSVAMFQRQALVMVNLGDATQQQVKLLSEAVSKDVCAKFKVNLMVEPIFWG
ncbi:UDP-N-acetylmuramate dehydrogenase [Chitinibacter bivalviorum]|uniref:UDP-N-acetylmuramate dehydrogenase n=1 Tax=Chitinibacter bivalviorum TaxID=2739434 RepID=UPI001FECD3FD